jgi:hypothetical protein
VTRDPIREGDIVRVTDPRDGIEHEGIADGGPEHGEVWVRFTTKGREIPVPAKYVTKVRDAW